MASARRTTSTPERDAAAVMTGGTSEAVLAGAVGGALGAATATLIGMPLVGVTIGAANGVVSGRRGIYDWTSAKGLAAFVLDSTWSLGNTAAALAAHALGSVRGRPAFQRRLSFRQNRHVYARGFQPRRGFAITLGNVVSGAGDTRRARRARLVTDHEDVHIWQARWFGPAFPVLYIGWMVGGALAGAVMWAVARRDDGCGAVVEACAYYLNPFEYWAYSRDGHWPPRQLVDGFGPTRPAVRSFASSR